MSESTCEVRRIGQNNHSAADESFFGVVVEDSRREAMKLLTTGEIAILLGQDPAWELPRWAANAVERNILMRTARAIFVRMVREEKPVTERLVLVDRSTIERERVWILSERRPERRAEAAA